MGRCPRCGAEIAYLNYREVATAFYVARYDREYRACVKRRYSRGRCITIVPNAASYWQRIRRRRRGY